MGTGILVVGSISIDMVAHSPRIPGPGQNVCDVEFQTVPGGKGANQAAAACRLGAETMIMGCVGTNVFGDVLLERLSSLGVDTSLVRRTGDAQTVLDAGPPRSVGDDLLSLFDIVSPNRDELSALTGREVTDPASAALASAGLLDAGVGLVVVKMGEAGAILVSAGGSMHFEAYRVKAVDATAAGDAFTAGLAVAVVEGKPIEDAVRFANAAGALAVTVFGAQPSMPPRGQVEGLIDSQKVRCTRL